MDINPRKRNWQYYCNSQIRDWYGLWTRYSSSGELIEFFQGLRSLSSNANQTEVVHLIRLTYADGRTEEKKWRFGRTADDKHLNSFYFKEGNGIIAPKLSKGKTYFTELFFRHDDLRLSVNFVYNYQGHLENISTIREDSASSNYWSNETAPLSCKEFIGNWRGTTQTLNYELDITSEPKPVEYHWGWNDNKSFYLPDGIAVNCPNEISLGIPFTVAVNWEVTSTHLKQLIFKCGKSGSLSSLTMELYDIS